MDWWNQPRSIQILVDNDSWILPWAEQLCKQVNAGGDRCVLRRTADELTPGDIVFLLGCTRIVPAEILRLNKRNLVVHESDLPNGRGFAPISWQVLAGCDEITVCLLEAAAEADSGDVFLRRQLQLRGDELCDELRALQGRATVEICLEYLRTESESQPQPQHGDPTLLARRTPDDSRLDIDKSLREQFNLLRICDNERYPAFFELDGKRYELRITEAPVDSQAANSPTAGDVGTTYLVAGCKSWNRTTFDQHQPGLAGNWHFVDSPETLTPEFVGSLRPSRIFFLHWSWMVPQEILQQTECVCFHMTDVPYGRGGSPLQNLIERGHRETVLTALRMTEELDAGPVYLKRPLSLQGTAAEILSRASQLSLQMICEIVTKPIVPQPQEGEVVTFGRRTPAQSELKQPENLSQVFDHIRMLDGEGYPRAFLEVDGFRYELSDAFLQGNQVRARVVIRPMEKPALGKTA